MSEVTLEAIAEVIQGELKNQLDPIKDEISSIRETVDSHTVALVEIAKDVKDLKEQMIVANHRFDKNEKAIIQTAVRGGVKEEVEKILRA